MSEMIESEGGEKIVVEIEVVEILIVEEFSKSSGGKKPPKAKHYEIRVDKTPYRYDHPHPTGREILERAGKAPAEWMLNQKFHGGHVKAVGLDERVDLTAPGVERFMTLPKDQTEGLRDVVRRQFDLPSTDAEFLDASGFHWETVLDNKKQLLFINQYAIPAGYNVPSAILALVIPQSYPDTQIDMVYFSPALIRSDQGSIRCLTPAVHAGIQFQQWSRHRTDTNPWRAGIDDLSTHLTLVQHWLSRELPTQKVAA